MQQRKDAGAEIDGGWNFGSGRKGVMKNPRNELLNYPFVFACRSCRPMSMMGAAIRRTPMAYMGQLNVVGSTWRMTCSPWPATFKAASMKAYSASPAPAILNIMTHPRGQTGLWRRSLIAARIPPMTNSPAINIGEMTGPHQGRGIRKSKSQSSND